MEERGREGAEGIGEGKGGVRGWVMLGDSLLMILMLRCGRRAGVQANEWAQLA
jgi:hypothetical protein